MNKILTKLKQDGDHDWMYEISARSMQIICANLDEAYRWFFNKTHGYPKFKSRKRCKPSYPVETQYLYFKSKTHLQVQKLGLVKYKTDMDFPIGKCNCQLYNARIVYKPARKIWMLTFMMEIEKQEPELTDVCMGIDLGVKELAVVAFGDEKYVFHNINKSKKVRMLEEKKKYLNKSLSRKYESSKKRTGRYEKTKNIIKEEQKLRKVYEKLNGIRYNHMHQVTHTIVSMLPKKVVMETIDIQNLLKINNRTMRKRILDQGMYGFMLVMQYKCRWNGIEFFQTPVDFASSKTCSSCGHKKKDLKVWDRTYICPKCGLTIDRDYNAAINLMRYVV